MRQFAKIFETPIGQVVVVRTLRASGVHTIRLYFNPDAQDIILPRRDFRHESKAAAIAALEGFTAERAEQVFKDALASAIHNFTEE